MRFRVGDVVRGGPPGWWGAVVVGTFRYGYRVRWTSGPLVGREANVDRGLFPVPERFRR